MFRSSIIVVFLIVLFAFCRNIDAIAWRYPSYYGNPVGDDAVGAVIFDPGIGSNVSECYGTTGTVTVSFVSCYTGSTYFGSSDNKIILANPYPISKAGFSPVLPDCSIACTDSTAKTVYASLEILIYNTANQPPVWNTTFPSSFTLNSLQPPQTLLSTPAWDPDIDKTSNGRVTYMVDTIDGSAVVTGVNDFLQYKNNGSSPDLLVIYTLPWDSSSQHLVNIAARDNPRNSTKVNKITKTLVITVSASATIGSKMVFPTTPSTAVYNSSTVIPFSLTTTLSPCAPWGTSWDSVICGNNWIWLAVGGAGLVAILILIIVAAVCFKRYGKNYRPGQGQDDSKKQQHKQHTVHPTDEGADATPPPSVRNPPPTPRSVRNTNPPPTPSHRNTTNPPPTTRQGTNNRTGYSDPNYIQSTRR